MKQLEEFMVFQDASGKTGVIIKGCHYSWWKCFREFGGQVFDEKDNHFNEIVKLYKVKDVEKQENIYFRALKFMFDGALNDWECVYDKETECENDSINIIINASVNPESIKDIEKVIQELQEKISNIKINMVM